MDLQLKGKVVLVTGGTGGIGSAIVKAFLAEGAKVAFSSTSQAKIDALLPTLKGDATGFVCDATDEEQVKALVESAIDAYGTLDVVIPNAGYEGHASSIVDNETDETMNVYTLNVFSPLWLMKYASPTLIEKGAGSIVVIASAGSYTPTATMHNYVSSKYAVAGVAKCVAQELMPKGIHVNYICPGPVDTDMMRRIERDQLGDSMSHEEAMVLFAGTALDKRYATPKEVADAVVFMASPLTAHTCGMGFNLDAIAPSC